jgi:hypothetical protein
MMSCFSHRKCSKYPPLHPDITKSRYDWRWNSYVVLFRGTCLEGVWMTAGTAPSFLNKTLDGGVWSAHLNMKWLLTLRLGLEMGGGGGRVLWVVGNAHNTVSDSMGITSYFHCTISSRTNTTQRSQLTGSFHAFHLLLFFSLESHSRTLW